MAHSFAHQAYEAFEEIRIDYVKSTAFRPETSLIAQEKLDRLDPLRLKYDNRPFNAQTLRRLPNCAQ